MAAFSGNWIIFQWPPKQRMRASYFSDVGDPMEAEKVRSAKIEADQNENRATFCNNSNCFFQQSVATSVSRARVYIFEQKFQSRFCDVRWETQPQSLSLEEEQMTRWGPRRGGSGGLLGTWQIIDDPSLRFRLGISEGKVIAVKSVKIDIHRRTAVLGSPRQRALYHISSVCQQLIFAIKTPMDFIFKSRNLSVCWKNTAPCELSARQFIWGGIVKGNYVFTRSLSLY